MQKSGKLYTERTHKRTKIKVICTYIKKIFTKMPFFFEKTVEIEEYTC